MSTEIAEEILEKVRQLPPEAQKDILDFIVELETRPEKEESATTQNLRSLWEKIDTIVESVPEDNWQDVPVDGAVNHDHYLYGAPKRY